ncbi:DCN1-like protein 5 isoform X2 [Neltuma alba]|uniref:DCN1-like protein 5 isoform X2 n=1 Tax=Neltuma alba TaxID=207710 RepID=UPI0010A37524|nr:DCN1-like protein 5 isoform X2 [Prosopis alba]
MPRPSKRKAASSADVDLSVSPAPKKSRTKQIDKVGHLFDTYANKSIDLIDPAGIESLCSDLGVDHTDIKILMLAWKMKSEKQGYFSKDEWRRGLKCLGVDTLPKLKKAVLGLDKEVMKSGYFEDFYNFAFQYCLTEDMQRSVDIETICELLNIVLGPQFPTQVNLLVEYLQIQSDYRAVNLDQWSSFYRFFKEIWSRLKLKMSIKIEYHLCINGCLVELIKAGKP